MTFLIRKRWLTVNFQHSCVLIPAPPPPPSCPLRALGPPCRTAAGERACTGRPAQGGRGWRQPSCGWSPQRGIGGGGGGGQRGEGVPAALGTRCCARTVRWYSFSTQSCSTHSPGELPGRETIPFHRLFELNNLVLGTYRGEVPPVENRGKGKLQHEAEASSPLCGGCCE